MCLLTLKAPLFPQTHLCSSYFKSWASATCHPAAFKGASALGCHGEWKIKIKTCCAPASGSTTGHFPLKSKDRHLWALLWSCYVLFFSGTSAAADYRDEESEENQKFLPKVNSAGEEKQRWRAGFILMGKGVADLLVWSIRCVLHPEGSETKLMLSKMKSQLEELRSKVTFLDCVRKYLEVLLTVEYHS